MKTIIKIFAGSIGVVLSLIGFIFTNIFAQLAMQNYESNKFYIALFLVLSIGWTAYKLFILSFIILITTLKGK